MSDDDLFHAYDAHVAYNMAYNFLDDVERIHAWWMTRNPLLRGLAPYEMVAAGESSELLRLVRALLAKNPARLFP